MVPPVEPAAPSEWFDRSAIAIDAMVVIEEVTEEEWWRRAPEGRVCEFFDGTVYMPSPASAEHQDEVGFWFDPLNGFRFARLGPEWVVRLGPGVLRLGPGLYPEPDVFVLPRESRAGDPPARLVVEVLSTSTRKHDLGRKAEEFRRASIPEIVYVDPSKRCLIVHQRRGESYKIQTIAAGAWISGSLPGLWVDTAWLWEDNLPSPRACLERILAGLPA